MKRILTFLVIAAGVTGIGFAAASSSDTLLPEKHGSAIREIVRTAVRHVLNFRKETPLTAEQRASVTKTLESHRNPHADDPGARCPPRDGRGRENGREQLRHPRRSGKTR